MTLLLSLSIFLDIFIAEKISLKGLNIFNIFLKILHSLASISLRFQLPTHLPNTHQTPTQRTPPTHLTLIRRCNLFFAAAILLQPFAKWPRRHCNHKS